MRDEFEYLKGKCNGHSFGDPNKVEERICGVCGSKCKIISKNVNGPTGWAESMSGRKHLHDVYECPYYRSEAHKDAYELIREMGRTASKRVRELIKMDLDELLAEMPHLE